MTLKVLSLFIYLCLHLSALFSARFERAMMETGGGAKKKGWWKKAVSVWASKIGEAGKQTIEKESERERERKQVTMWKRHNLNHHWLSWLLSVTTLLFLSLSTAKANCSQQFIFNWCSRGQREGRATRTSQWGKKIAKRSAWWRKWGWKAKTIDWIH